MKTNQKTNVANVADVLPRSAQVLGSTHMLVLSVAAGAMLCLPSHATAQAAAEAGAVARSTTAPVVVQSRAGAAAPVQMTISMNPAMATAPQADVRGPNCTGAVRGESSVVVPVGKSSLISLPEPVRNRTLGNPNVVQATMVSPQSMYLLGRSVGTTNMIVQGRSGACSIVNVVVNADAGGLQTSLAQLMPGESKIRVTTAADSLVLAGNVSSAQAAQQAMEIARAYAVSAQSGSDKGGGAAGGGMGGSSAGGANVINMMIVDTPQQVMLEVKIAEVSKTLLNQLGSTVNLQGGFGSWVGGLATSLLTGSATQLVANKMNNRPFQIGLDAQKNDGLVKILAEPNLVTLSGQEANFLAGGKIYIPIAQGGSVGGGSVITLQEEEYGVGLKFTPTVMANGRINLKVAPEVSELSSTGATISGSNASANGVTVLPLITTRRASTTVQMRDGESFAIGGLLQDNARGSLKALPGAGEVPVLGALFRSTQFQHDLTELVIVITPHLVQPMQTASYPLPTDSFSTPNDLDVYMTGNMEGRGAKNRTAKPASAAAPAAAPMTPAQAPSAPSAPSSQAPAPAPAAPAPVAPAAPAPRAEVSTVPVTPPANDAPATPAVATPVEAATPTPAAELTPADDNAERVARIEATAARLAQARARAQGRQTAVANTTTTPQTR